MSVLDEEMTRYRIEREQRLASLPPWAKVPGEDDLPPRVVVRRGGESIVTIKVAQESADPSWRDAGLTAARAGAIGYAADEVIWLMDAHMRTLGPGEEYEYGDMQRQCHEEAACTRGEITDLLMGQLFTRSGGCEDTAVLPYFLYADERRIEWRVPPEGLDKADRFSGEIPEAILDGFAQPTMLETAMADEKLAGLGLDAEQMWTALARVVTASLVEEGYTLMGRRADVLGVG